MNLRLLLIATGAWAAAAVHAPAAVRTAEAEVAAGRADGIRVAVADWMVLKRQKLGEFQLARDLGCEGVEMDMGGLGARDTFDNKLRQPHFRTLFRRTADSLGVSVAAVAMSGFYGQSFATKPTWRALVAECLDAMDAMGCRTAFLPLGGCGSDWPDRPSLRDTITARLREAGRMAEERGMTIGIDTPLSADDNIRLLRQIRSRGIKIFYKVQTAVEHHRDPAAELRRLGRKRLAAALHVSNTDGSLLRHDPAVDLPAIVSALRGIKWTGWLIIERSRQADRVRDVKFNYSDNAAYIHSTLQTANRK